MNTINETELDEFLQHYITCALWSSNDESTPEGGDPFDQNYSDADIAPETLALMRADCAKFLAENKHLIEDEGRSNALSAAAHDFWLTRNYHGTGFWDGDWPKHGDALDAASKAFGEQYLYLGDDGKIYI